MTVAAVQRIAKASTAGTSTIDSGTGWATPTAGNLIVVTANSDATVTMTSSGYTAGPSVVDNNAVYAWYKVAAGTETSVVVTLGASTEIVHTACEYSGLTASPFDVSNTSTIPNTDGTSTTSVSVTTTVDGDLVIALAGLADFSGSGANPTSPSWTNSFTNQLTSVSTGALGVRCNSFYAELIAGTAGAVSTSASWTNSAFKRQELVLAFKAAAATSIPWAPPRLAQPRDYGEAQWIQRDRRDANTVAAAASPLPSPLDVTFGAGGQYWHLYSDAADAGRVVVSRQRTYPDLSLLGSVTDPPPAVRPAPITSRSRGAAQRPYISAPALLTTALLENELLGGADLPKRYLTPATHVDRRDLPQQRSYFDATLLQAALLENELLGGSETTKRHRPATHVDRREVPQQRAYISNPSLLGTAQLDELLGSADTLKRYLAPATHGDRRTVPQQRQYNDTYLLLTALLEGALLGGAETLKRHLPATNYDRRLVPQQRQYISDPSVYPTLDPLGVAWGAGGAYWLTYNTAAVTVTRRLVAQQRPYVSDPSLLTTALLEAPLLVGSFRPTVGDRRIYVYPPVRFASLDLDADPLLVAGGSGGDGWRRTNARLVFPGPWWRHFAPGPPVPEPPAVAIAASSDAAVSARRTSTSAVDASRTSASSVTARTASNPTVTGG